ncbi:glucose-6-phosphatase 2 isoform X1 [Drosophila miranda]|uniref:glucose-6-phosphatase 2 isoform X1 n=1 Tax=Drosophila miranda TaxID=7229 RepID=UPI0007E5F5D5|nr:glucose-6-phosphatase 2 isoform X1 [Drosophila miranda]
MDGNLWDLAVKTYNHVVTAELRINELVQERLSLGDPLWRFLSVYLEPGLLFNLVIPLCGIYSQALLTRLLFAVGLASTLNSFAKWILPEQRPLWLLREIYASNVRSPSPGVALESHPLSCETTAGMPCAHSMSFTMFTLTIWMFLYAHSRQRWLAGTVVHGLIFCMWLSRLYLATEFLHQCVLGTFIGIQVMDALDQKNDYLWSRRRRWAVTGVFLLGGLATAVYFVKLSLDIDPHWSVREAFKWCPDPSYMRHEASPIFFLVRDLGILMGIALASPLSNLDTKNASLWRRCIVLAILELFNFGMRWATPKQNGRFAFLAYELFRNAVHSLLLLKNLPRLW